MEVALTAKLLLILFAPLILLTMHSLLTMLPVLTLLTMLEQLRSKKALCLHISNHATYLELLLHRRCS